MKIEIIDKAGNQITDFELQSNPFKLGERINISITNNDKAFWNVEEVSADFKVVMIEHFYRKNYKPNGRVYDIFVTSITVQKINY